MANRILFFNFVVYFAAVWNHGHVVDIFYVCNVQKTGMWWQLLQCILRLEFDILIILSHWQCLSSWQGAEVPGQADRILAHSSRNVHVVADIMFKMLTIFVKCIYSFEDLIVRSPWNSCGLFWWDAYDVTVRQLHQNEVENGDRNLFMRLRRRYKLNSGDSFLFNVALMPFLH